MNDPLAGAKKAGDGGAETAILEGLISLEAAIKGGNREVAWIALRADKFDRPAVRAEQLARQGNIPLRRLDGGEINNLARGSSHGGILAGVGPRHYLAPEELLRAAGSSSPFIAMLDGIEDPFNFGQSVRALYAAGATGLVLRPRNWLSAAAVVTRASAGASELMPTAIMATAMAAADFFAQQGLAVACAVKDSPTSIYDADLTMPLFLVLGGEKRGISRTFGDKADLRLTVPYHSQLGPEQPFSRALGTVAATAVIAFEVMRQRRRRGQHQEAGTRNV